MEEVITEEKPLVDLHIEQQPEGGYQISLIHKKKSDGVWTASKATFHRAKDRTEMYGLVLHLTGGT